MHSSKDFTGRPRWEMQCASYALARAANITPRKYINQPKPYKPIPPMWPFAVWGLDLVGPLEKAHRGLHPPACRGRQIHQVDRSSPDSENRVRGRSRILSRHCPPVWSTELHNHGQWHTVQGEKFLKLCDDYHVSVDWATLVDPQSNGQVELANGMVLQGLKPWIYSCLKQHSGRWMVELSGVLWSL